MRLAPALLLAPAVALAQGAPPPPKAPDAPTGRLEQPQERWERVERRIRLARALGLADALDLDEAQAARMNEVMVSFDAKRKPLLEQIRSQVRVLREAARPGRTGRDAKVPPPDPKLAGAVDQATAAIFDARGQLLALDREMLQTLSKGLSPEKKARMALFFARFRQRFGMEILERSEHGGGGGGPGGPRPSQEPRGPSLGSGGDD